MKQVWRLALNDLRLTMRDRSSFVWMLLMPVAMMWFFGNLGGGANQGPPQVSLGVVSHDDGWLARAVIEELRGEQVNLREMTPDEAAVADDKVRTLVIPAGFTDQVLSGEQQTLRLEKEPDSSAEFGIAAEVHSIRAIVRTVRRLSGRRVSADEASVGDAAVRRFRELGERDELVVLDVSTAGTGRPVPTGRAQSVPGILTMMVLMMTMIYGGVFLTTEKQTGMLRRQAGLPLGRLRLFAGKLTGRLLMAALQIVVLVVVGRFLLGITWGNSPAGLAMVLISYTVAVAGMATFVGAVFSTPAQASGVGWIGSMVMAAIGGCWWPAEIMPDWMQAVAHAFPTAWAMDGFHALISFGHGPEAVVLPSVVLLGFGVLFSALGARFLRFG